MKSEALHLQQCPRIGRSRMQLVRRRKLKIRGQEVRQVLLFALQSVLSFCLFVVSRGDCIVKYQPHIDSREEDKTEATDDLVSLSGKVRSRERLLTDGCRNYVYEDKAKRRRSRWRQLSELHHIKSHVGIRR